MKKKKWSRANTKCVACKKTTSPHMARGYCGPCYQSEYRANNVERIADSKKAWYEGHRDAQLTKSRDRRERVHFGGNRQACLDRDGGMCTVCGGEDQLTAHHIDHNGRGKAEPNNELSNLQTMCRACHASHHSKSHGWSRKYTCCIVCGGTSRRHNAKGKCVRCYGKRATSDDMVRPHGKA